MSSIEQVVERRGVDCRIDYGARLRDYEYVNNEETKATGTFSDRDNNSAFARAGSTRWIQVPFRITVSTRLALLLERFILRMLSM